MESGKENCLSKHSPATSSPSEATAMVSYQDWSNSMKHALMPPYCTPILYPSIYPSNGVYSHTTVSQGPSNDQRYRKRKMERNLVENTNGTSGSGNDAVSISGSSNGSEDNSTQKSATTKNGKLYSKNLNKNSNQLWKPGDNVNKGMALWIAPGTGAGTSTARSNPSSIYDNDERELKREKRKQSNRESARRSRLRKQAECEELQARVHDLGRENNQLQDELRRLSDECANLRAENDSIKEDLTRVHGANALANLELGNGLVEEK